MDENLTETTSEIMEEATEQRTINYMAIGVVVIGAAGLLFLALRPLLKQMRAEDVATSDNEMAAESGPPAASPPADANGAGA